MAPSLYVVEDVREPLCGLFDPWVNSQDDSDARVLGVSVRLENVIASVVSVLGLGQETSSPRLGCLGVRIRAGNVIASPRLPRC